MPPTREAVLRDPGAKQELYRRWVAAYEDKAIVKNGDLERL